MFIHKDHDVYTTTTGEYGELLLPEKAPPLLPGEEPVTASDAQVVGLIEAVLRRKDVGATTKEYALTALIKMSARMPAQDDRIRSGILANARSLLLEVQQRSCEFGKMFSHNDVRGHLVEAIPPLDESTYARNMADQAVADGAAVVGDLVQPANGSSAPVAAGAADLMDLLSLDVTPEPATTVAAAPVVDLLGDLLGNGQGALCRVEHRTAHAPHTHVTVSAPPAAPAAVGLDMLGDMLGAPAPAAPATTAVTMTPFSKDGITVAFALTKGGAPGTTTVHATYTNKGGSPVTGFTLQAAVPKFMQLKLDPASSGTLAAGGGVATQTLHVTNSMHGQKPLVMRLRISYSVGGAPAVVEQCEVNNFPPGY